MSKRRIIILVAMFVFLLLAASLIMPLIPNEKGWIRSSQQRLSSLGRPPETLSGVAPGRWASDQWLIFSNGWAAFAYEAPHDTLFPRNYALLLTSQGNYYISHHHFCDGSQEFAGKPMPGDIADFMRTYEERQGWRPLR